MELLGQRGGELLGRLVHLGRVGVLGAHHVGQAVAGHIVGRENVDVRVRHFESGDEVAGSF